MLSYPLQTPSIHTNTYTSELITDSSQWDNVLTKMFLNFDAFPEIKELISKNNITIGSILAPEIIQLVAKSAVSNFDLRKELFTGINYISFLSLTCFGDHAAIETNVVRLMAHSRVSSFPSSQIILEEELNQYMYDTLESVVNAVRANKWLLVIYLFAYVFAFVGAPEEAKE